MKPFILFFLAITSGFSGLAQIYRVQEMSTTEIQELDRDSTVVLIPGGILEQHGPYLPSFSDGYMNLALTEEIAEYVVNKQGMDVLVFPLIPLGTGGANEIGNRYSFPGTYAIRAKTLRALLMDLGSELAEQGFKKIFIIHMHGGPNHNEAIDQAAQFFKEVHDGTMVNIWNLAYTSESDIKTAEQKNEDGFSVHAGMDEHSIVYHLQPKIVGEEFKQAKPQAGKNFEDLVRIAQEESWPGYFGSPRLGGAEYGETIWNSWVEGIIKQVGEILNNEYDFDRPTYFQVMNGNPTVNSVIEGSRQNNLKKETIQEQWLKNKGLK